MSIRLSESKNLAFRQCERRLWLELHRPELRQDDDASRAAFATGHRFSGVARRLYDPDGGGMLTGPQADGFAAAGTLAFADIPLPAGNPDQARWHHPDQRGSWSIKYVTPAVAPDLRYDQLEGVQNGGGAMHADLEAIDEATTHARKGELEAQLRDYCRPDTLAMVRLW